MNPVGGGYSELILCHYTPVWVTTVKLHLKKQKTKSSHWTALRRAQILGDGKMEVAVQLQKVVVRLH